MIQRFSKIVNAVVAAGLSLRLPLIRY